MAQNFPKSASRPCSRRFCCHAVIYSACIGLVSSTHHPLMHKIDNNEKQCILSRFNRGDFATFEIFIAEADADGRPTAFVEIQGPVISPDIGEINENGKRTWPNVVTDTDAGHAGGRFKPPFANTMGESMQKLMLSWDSFVKDHANRLHEVGGIHHDFRIDYTHSGESEDAIAARSEFHRQRAAEFQRLEEAREHIDDEKYQKSKALLSQTILPEWIEPYEFTKAIDAAGWYRMCVTSMNYVLVEMDIRSSADLGGMNRDTGHVYTYDERETLDEEERIKGLGNNKGPSSKEVEASLVKEELGKVLENQVRENDLEASKGYLVSLNEMVALLQKRQTSSHHRIKGHENDARRNYKRIVRSGILETVLYLLITLFQVYTLRKWLLGNTGLGR